MDVRVSFAELSKTYDELPMFPVFDIAHYILMILQLRNDAGVGAEALAESNALACWLCGMLSCFGGKIVANFLLGQPVIAAFNSTKHIITATIVWYLMFYSPWDVCYRLISTKLGKLLVYPIKEFSRAKKVASGVAQAAVVYPQGFAVMIIIGAVKGTGSLFIRNVERLLRGVWTPTSNEIMSPSATFKISVTCAFLLTVERMGYIPFPPEQIMFGLTMFIVPYKVSVILLKIGDPYVHVERALRPMLFKKRKRTDGVSQSGKKEATKDQKKKNNDKDSKKKAE
ncbi:trimeric intracellular cation channel type 1B.1-like [Apostichopus japonicus]|uniref:trimeric intracellular cation channel type 1B.1-like n=1 Tax=Stichopus japonicus TaxID=307972 RepID=UPI003AB21E92